MTRPVVLKNIARNGKPLQVVFSPLQGMNLLSYKKGDIEIIDQSTKDLFDERFAGLGAIIGPHFYHRKAPPVIKNSTIPYLLKAINEGRKEPFSHGIGRYVPWHYKASETIISAHLSSTDRWYNTPLRDLEGFDFEMTYEASLTPDGLQIKLSVEADSPSVVGLHTYYKLERESKLSSQVQPVYNDMGIFKPIHPSWQQPEQTHLQLLLSDAIDAGFLPIHKNHGSVLLDNKAYSVYINFKSEKEELSLQIYHPKDASFACIEPISAKNPRDLVTKSSSIEVKIEILP